MYRPCAPDGFIPNSVVRDLYNKIDSQHPSNVKEEEEWKPPVWLDEWGEMKKNNKNEAEQDEDKDSKPRQWLSDDDSNASSRSRSRSSTSNPRKNSTKVSFDIRKHGEDSKSILPNNERKGDVNLTPHTPILHQNSNVDKLSTTLNNQSEHKNLALNQSEDTNKTTVDQSTEDKTMEDLIELTSNSIFPQTTNPAEDQLKLPSGHFNMEEEPTLVPYPVLDFPSDVPSPFLKYYNESWFPKHVYTDITAVVANIISSLSKANNNDLKTMLQCLVETHRFCGLEGTLMEDLISSLLQLLTSSDAHARLYGVRTLRELGLDRDDIILGTIPLLEDPSGEVREEAKRFLKEVAGVVDAASLTALLTKLGVFRMDENGAQSDDDLDDKENRSARLVVEITPRDNSKENSRLEKDAVAIDDDSAADRMVMIKNTPMYDQGDDLWRGEDEDLSLQRRTVPGVIGERILSEVVMVSNTESTIRSCEGNTELIKPIPGRHGCATLKKDGWTMYGRLGYKWTTYSTEYDMKSLSDSNNYAQHIEEQHRTADLLRTKDSEEGGVGHVVSTTIDMKNRNPPNLTQKSIVRAYKKNLIDP